MPGRRVLVVYTGGTLGMRPTEHGWEPGADLAGWLTDLVRPEFPDLSWELVTLAPLIDSSNATPAQWQRIVDVVREHHATHDAFVVLHGTDTLAFTAAALHVALPDPARAVVLTGAQRSLVLPDSDAPGNVLGALRAAVDERCHGVCVFFDGSLMDADHVTKVSSVADHAFDSPNREPLAVTDHAGELVFPDGAELGDPDGPSGVVAPYRDVDVVVLTLHPGLRAARLRAALTPPPQAVVLRAHGVGNAPDNDPDLLAALAEAHDAGTVVVVTTQCPHGGVELGTYAVSQGLLGVGAVCGGTLTTEALVARLTFGLSQGHSPDEVRRDLRRAVEAHWQGDHWQAGH